MYYPDNSERTVIKADPGWFVAYPWREDGKQGVFLKPVVAWLIVHGASAYHHSVKAVPNDKHVHAHPYPIATDGVQDDDNYSCIKRPDGRFVAYEQTWENEAELLAGWPFTEPKAA